MDDKANLIREFAHDVDSDDRGGRRLVAGTVCTSEGFCDERGKFDAISAAPSRPVATLHIGELRVKNWGEPVRIDHGLLFAALDRLAGIVPAPAATLGILHALAVENGSGGEAYRPIRSRPAMTR